MDKLRKIEFSYRYEGENGWGKREGLFHTWYEFNKELMVLIENEKGELDSYNYSDCADVRFVKNIKNK